MEGVSVSVSDSVGVNVTVSVSATVSGLIECECYLRRCRLIRIVRSQ